MKRKKVINNCSKFIFKTSKLFCYKKLRLKETQLHKSTSRPILLILNNITVQKLSLIASRNYNNLKDFTFMPL
jgi:hypothetical protein